MQPVNKSRNLLVFGFREIVASTKSIELLCVVHDISRALVTLLILIVEYLLVVDW